MCIRRRLCRSRVSSASDAGRFSTWVLILGLVIAAVFGSSARAERTPSVPTPGVPAVVSEVERAGVVLAVNYLEGGPQAWLSALEEGSFLSRMDAEAAAAEIEVRAGPPNGAVWRLQRSLSRYPDGTVIFSVELPSGLDETLFVRLVEREGDWKIADVRCLVDPGLMQKASDFLSLDRSWLVLPGPERGIWTRHAMWLVIAALALSSIWWHSRALGLCVIALVILACAPKDEPVPADGPPLVELRSLLPIRRSLAGAGSEDHAEVFRTISKTGDAYEVAKIWELQYLISQVELDAATKMLSWLPEAAQPPLVDLLRGRLAFLQSDSKATLRHYERLFEQSADHDSLRSEAAEAYLLLGLVEESLSRWSRLALGGTRLAEVYYYLAQFNSSEDERAVGNEYLRTAWGLQPIERSELLGKSLLALLSAVPDFFETFSYGETDEPVVLAEDRGRRSIAIPESATAWLLGRLLTIEVEGGVLEVPGGSELAPDVAQALSAKEYQQRRQLLALAELESLRSRSNKPASFASPSFRRTLVSASQALAREERWKDLIDLTEGVVFSLEQSPALLVRLRAVALSQLDRGAEAQDLLIRLARNEVANKRKDPDTFSHLAELFAADEQYELAIKSMQKSQALSPLRLGAARIRELEMERTLATSYESHESRHFRIRASRATSTHHLDQVIALLEAERGRLLRWIPSKSSEPIEVHLFQYEDFMRTYSSGVEVVGLFDGRVKLPLANVESFDPRIVSILSHEVAHAMIAQATGDRAPRWFQEGLAQHVEMGGLVINPLPDLAKASRILAFPLIESVLSGFSEAKLLDLAYSESAWIVHYISARYGVGGIHRLLKSFASGAGTDDALESALGVTSSQFETAAWAWGIERAPQSWQSTVVRYEYQDDNGLVTGDSRMSTEASSFGGSNGSRRSSGGAQMNLAGWQRLYEVEARPVKVRLASLLPVLRGQILAGSKAECQALSAEVRSFLATPGVLDAPVPGVRPLLRTAYASFANAAKMCVEDELEAAKAELARAEASLGKAAQLLSLHGVRP